MAFLEKLATSEDVWRIVNHVIGLKEDPENVYILLSACQAHVVTDKQTIDLGADATNKLWQVLDNHLDDMHLPAFCFEMRITLKAGKTPVFDLKLFPVLKNRR